MKIFTESAAYFSAVNRTAADKTEKASQKKYTCGKDTLTVSEEGKNLFRKSVSLSEGVSAEFKDKDRIAVTFENSAYAYRAVRSGITDIGGNEYILSGRLKENLRSAAEKADDLAEKNALAAAALHDLEVNEQQREAIEKQAKDNAKMSEIADRIMKGGIVPPSDEKKLARYDPDLYMLAKSLSVLAKHHEKYDALIEDDEDTSPEKYDESSESPIGEPLEIKIELTAETELL